MAGSNAERILELQELIDETYKRVGIDRAWAIGTSANELRAKQDEVERYIKPFRDELKKLKRT